MRRACALALGCLLLAGCASRGRTPAPVTGPALGAKADATLASSTLVVGRIIAIDAPSLSVLIEVGAFTVLPPDFATRILIVRTDDLRPTARLQSSSYLRGRILGTRLMAGVPHIGDEVVCAPTNP